MRMIRYALSLAIITGQPVTFGAKVCLGVLMKFYIDLELALHQIIG